MFKIDESKCGGTEIAVRWFNNNVLPLAPRFNDYQCIVIPNDKSIRATDVLDTKKKGVVIWLHIFPDEMLYEKVFFQDKSILEKISFFITVSHHHKENLISKWGVDPNKIVVIQHSIDKPVSDTTRFYRPSILRMVHASNSNRGMETLIRSLKYVEKDFELFIYNDFNQFTDNRLHVDKILDDKRVYFMGTVDNKTVIEEFCKSHIHPYPATFKETACRTQIEALASGCLCVFNDIGALGETSRGWGMMYDLNFQSDISNRKMQKEFAKVLTNAINIVNSGLYDPTAQIEDICSYYSHDRILGQWLDFHERL